MDYSETIAYLYSLTDYEKTRVERYSPEVFSLARIKRLLTLLGEPHTAFPALHIAGTKGKGSTAALCNSCLRAAGYRTGLYTSPHLYTFRERIQIAGEKIAPQGVVDLVKRVRPLVDEVPGVTTFEVVTAMAFLHFADQQIDIAVLEVGLGGRLDATNVVTPEVSIITSLSLDHTYLLGDTLADIAVEKGGIIKPGVPVVVAPQRDEAMDVLARLGRQRKAPLIAIGRDWTYTPGSAEPTGQSFTVQKLHGNSSPLTGEFWLPLLGRHQLENATCAIAALDRLRKAGFVVSREAVDKGLHTVRWPGRMEVLGREPLVVVDCAHNPYSARVLREALADWFPERRWVLIFGASADKDVAGMLRALAPTIDYTIVTRSAHPRAVAPVVLADVTAEVSEGAEVSVSVEKALDRARKVAGANQGLLVTGSIFLVAEARNAWLHRKENQT